eukprot:150437-Amphidinium_carterae.2
MGQQNPSATRASSHQIGQGPAARQSHKVISELCKTSTTKVGSVEVPSHAYRASSLTKILADAFMRGSQAKLAVMCTVSAASALDKKTPAPRSEAVWMFSRHDQDFALVAHV